MERPAAQAPLPLRWTTRCPDPTEVPAGRPISSLVPGGRGHSSGAPTKTSFPTVCPCVLPFRWRLSLSPGPGQPEPPPARPWKSRRPGPVWPRPPHPCGEQGDPLPVGAETWGELESFPPDSQRRAARTVLAQKMVPGGVCGPAIAQRGEGESPRGQGCPHGRHGAIAPGGGCVSLSPQSLGKAEARG